MQIKFLKKGGRGFFLLRLFYFIVLVAAADFAVGKLLGYFYTKQQSGYDYSTRYAAEETKAGMLIFGASRAQQQYNPLYFEDSLGLSCYNAGRDGTPLFYHYAILQSVYKRYSPKVIILDCEFAALKKSPISYDRLSCLLPLYKSHPEMQGIINLRSAGEKYKFISSTYPYNSMLFKIAIGNIKKNKEGIDFIKGYVPLNKKLADSIKTYDLSAPYELDSIKISMLRGFINSCKEKNTKLFLVCPPYYMKAKGTEYSLATIRQIAKETNTPFFDYSQDTSYFSKPYLFDDTVHLNFNGSKIFCEMLAGKLKRELGNAK